MAKVGGGAEGRREGERGEAANGLRLALTRGESSGTGRKECPVRTVERLAEEKQKIRLCHRRRWWERRDSVGRVSDRVMSSILTRKRKGGVRVTYEVQSEGRRKTEPRNTPTKHSEGVHLATTQQGSQTQQRTDLDERRTSRSQRV